MGGNIRGKAMKTPLYRRLANLILQRQNCIASNNTEWLEKSTTNILGLVKLRLPSGSGFDQGTKIDLRFSSPEQLVFHTSFHHMTDDGVYDGWTEHTVFVQPSLAMNFVLVVKGPNRNEIKDYIEESFRFTLEEDVICES
jgi:hypothetical protein